MPANVFKAPWSGPLITTTGLTCVLLLGIVLIGVFTGPRTETVWLASMVGLPLAILAVTALLAVRGYVVAGQTLQVQRLLWSTPISLANLQTAKVDPQAMRNSLRTWGNGGLFGYTGHFRNAHLGPYQAFVTDFERTVVLTFSNRKIVLSPANPAEFVECVLPRTDG